MQAINFKEVDIRGSRVYERTDFQVAIDMAMALPLEAIISREFPLHDVSDAFRLLLAGDVCKVMILPCERHQ
jgi:D-arabinose 1-dehydrogenase-like Zn-dependent alcohol dehydrogenase